ncbi:MAG TPA: DUF3892 domain-containing protein [Candidatus Avimonas sp.]|nr:DUF3892 domain-containing protein [Clostridiales bacterium]HPU57999.1 DUF3892 domain-containing protein [Candidatus Avimonas sp.]
MEKNMNMTNLPMQTLKDIPQPKSDAKSIVALVKENGRTTGYQLSDGRIVDKQQGVQLAKQGEIKGVGIGVRNGNEYLKSLPDDSENNNLGSLPSISKQAY